MEKAKVESLSGFEPMRAMVWDVKVLPEFLDQFIPSIEISVRKNVAPLYTKD